MKDPANDTERDAAKLLATIHTMGTGCEGGRILVELAGAGWVRGHCVACATDLERVSAVQIRRHAAHLENEAKGRKR